MIRKLPPSTINMAGTSTNAPGEPPRTIAATISAKPPSVPRMVAKSMVGPAGVLPRGLPRAVAGAPCVVDTFAMDIVSPLARRTGRRSWRPGTPGRSCKAGCGRKGGPGGRGRQLLSVLMISVIVTPRRSSTTTTSPRATRRLLT